MPIVGAFGSLVGLGFFAAGAFESLGTVSLGGNATNFDFQSIPSVYQHLQIRCVLRTDRTSNAADGFTVRLNNDTASNYSWHRLSFYGASSTAGAGSSVSLMSTWVDVITGPSATSSIFGVAVIDILDYASTSKNTTIRTFAGNDRNGAGIVALASGLWNSTAAVNRITVAPLAGSNFVQYSTAALYGVMAP